MIKVFFYGFTKIKVIYYYKPRWHTHIHTHIITVYKTRQLKRLAKTDQKAPFIIPLAVKYQERLSNKSIKHETEHILAVYYIKMKS